jgi:DNA-binding CsgD family transcriptional regulator
MLFHILVFYIAFTLNVFYQMYSSYIKQNAEFFFRSTRYYNHLINTFIFAFLIFSIPYFASYISNFKWRKIQNILSVVTLSSILFFYLIINNWKNDLILLEVFLLISIAYSITIGLISYKKINDKEQKRLLRNVCIVAIIFFPGNIYNEFPIFGFNLTVSPLLYCSFCVVFISFIVKIYFRDYYISEQEIEALKNDFRIHKKENVFNKYNLSDRERDVIIFVLKGFSNKKIADTLFISLSTVKSHIHNVFKKTNTGTRYELIHLIKFS